MPTKKPVFEIILDKMELTTKQVRVSAGAEGKLIGLGEIIRESILTWEQVNYIHGRLIQMMQKLSNKGDESVAYRYLNCLAQELFSEYIQKTD